MNKYPILAVFKQVLTPEEVQIVTGQTKDYVDRGTQMTVQLLLDYLVQTCYHKWDGFRQSARFYRKRKTIWVKNSIPNARAPHNPALSPRPGGTI